MVSPDGAVEHVRHRPVLPTSPAPGFVEFDAREMADAALAVAHEALDAGGPVEGVGIANQRASTIVWDRVTGKPVGPGKWPLASPRRGARSGSSACGPSHRACSGS